MMCLVCLPVLSYAGLTAWDDIFQPMVVEESDCHSYQYQHYLYLYLYSHWYLHLPPSLKIQPVKSYLIIEDSNEVVGTMFMF